MRPILTSEKLEEKLKPGTRIGRQLESVRARIADLQQLEDELARAQSALASPAPASSRVPPAQDISAELESRFGCVPAYLEPARAYPDLMDALWRHARAACHDNAVPMPLKEKILVLLARNCHLPYPMIGHCVNLRSWGMPAEEIYRLIRNSVSLPDVDVEQRIASFVSTPVPASSWPRPGSALEECLLQCAHLLYLMPEKAGRWHQGLKRLLGDANYTSLISLIAFARAHHLWVCAHPSISHEREERLRSGYAGLIVEDPRLEELFTTYYEGSGTDRQRLDAERALQASEDRYRDLFENATEMIYTHDLDGRITSVNKAAERLTGYSRAEALQMSFMQLIAPEHADLVRRMLDRPNGTELPPPFEIEIIAKDGRRAALEVTMRLICREGKPVAVQGVGRDISERKRTEEALQQANQKLGAWVHELEQRTREMTLLSEMGDMLRACLTMEEAYNVIVRVAQQIFPVHVGVLYVITPSRNLVEAVAVWGESSLAEKTFSPEDCWALRRGRMHWVENTRTGLLCKHLHQASDTYLCVPMMAQSEALGMLHLVQSANSPITEAKQRLAVTMAEHIAMALSNLKLHESLRSQSIRDPLTGLFNRRFMEESLELETRRAGRNHRPLGVIMLDLDHFKHFNDTFGHEAGDALLKELGALLQAQIRGADIACRYGGEEFTLILPEGAAEVTRERAELIRESIKKLDVEHRSRPLGRITASMGVAVFPEHGRTAETLLQAADAALYKSKDEGRDRVTVAR